MILDNSNGVSLKQVDNSIYTELTAAKWLADLEQ